MRISDDLNVRERISLKAIYIIDQDQERSDRRLVARSKLDLPTSSEKGWLNYHPLQSQTESYLQTAIGKTLTAEETNTTFEALKMYGLIECKYTLSDGVSVLWLRMTSSGHKIANNVFISTSYRRPKSSLFE
jgi:hypothetical protein